MGISFRMIMHISSPSASFAQDVPLGDNHMEVFFICGHYCPFTFLASQITDHAFYQFTIGSMCEFLSNPYFTLSSDSFIQI